MVNLANIGLILFERRDTQMGANTGSFEIERGKVARYFCWAQILAIAGLGILLFGVGIVLAPIYMILVAPWLPKLQAEALEYRLDGSTLRIDQGVFFLKRKAIPLDRVTDISLAQGPLMRMCGIWKLNIHTAGTGEATPEGVLYGVYDPETLRDQLLQARDHAARPVLGNGT